MKFLATSVFVLVIGVLLFLAGTEQKVEKPDSKELSRSEEIGKRMKVSGEFEVDLKPLESYSKGENGVNLGRMSIDKTFTGGLTGTSKGEMLSAMTSVKGSAGYTAIEQFTGTLSGKKGSFVIQHFATMQGDKNFMRLEVVPDSGSGELEGLSGKMIIRIEEGKHFYDFGYQFE